MTSSLTSGLLIVDKLRGPTSFAVVARVRRMVGGRSIAVGHAGTLDPLATGVLPVLVGEATKLVPWLMGLDKEYVATVLLGVVTDSCDAEGQVLTTVDASAVTRADVQAALAHFVGEIDQRPPLHSAIKHEGKKLYEMARAGIEFEPAARKVRIDEILLEEWSPPSVVLRVRCGKGTYIRSLARDLGERLGVGGHITALRRTRVGGLRAEDGVDPFVLESLEGARWIPPADAVAHLPALTIDAEVERRVRMGQQGVLATLDALAAPESTTLRLLDTAGRLVAIIERGPNEPRWSIARVFV